MKDVDFEDGLVKSVTRAFDVVFAVADSPHPPSATTLAETLELPRSTVQRLQTVAQDLGRHWIAISTVQPSTA